MKTQPAKHDSSLPPLALITGREDIGFALRTTLAGIAALLTAMWLQLDTPRWAMWTVFIVSPPVRGNALRKTVARLIGTAIGCIAGVAIVAMFPQERFGFYGLLSLWLGACAYWATLRRGYVSYAASLAAFTSAIVSAGVSSQPLEVWHSAVYRGSATVVGVVYALLASNMAATTDNVPGDLARRIVALAADLLDWAVVQLQRGRADDPKDAPLATKILALDEACGNALAERPSLNRVKLWIRGIPTALLSLQSAVLSLRDAAGHQGPARSIAGLGTDVLQHLAVFLRSAAVLDPAKLRRETDALADLKRASSAQTSAMQQMLDALAYLLTGLEAIVTLSPPEAPVPHYPQPRFVAHPRLARTNLIRTFVGVAAGFVIWDLTAWPHGPVFMVNVAVALVVFVTMEDPVFVIWATIIGTTVGCIIGLSAKYVLLIGGNDPLNLLIVLFPPLFIGAWIQTRGKLGPLGLFLIIGLLIEIEPRNPQTYDFVYDINTLIAIEFAYAFISLVFVTIGAPRRGLQRVAELLVRMRQRRRELPACATRLQRLAWETQMYDELQRLQAATKDPRHREHGVKLLLNGLKPPAPFTAAPAGLAMN